MRLALIAHYLGPQLGIGQFIDRLVPPLLAALAARGIDAVVLGSPNAIARTPALQGLDEKLIAVPALDYSPGHRYAWVASALGSLCRRHGIGALAWLSNPMVLPWHPSTLPAGTTIPLTYHPVPDIA